MIGRRLEHVLERLAARLVEHDLALSELTAAAVYHLTARDLTRTIDFAARTPLSRPHAEQVARDLHQDIDELQHLLPPAPSSPKGAGAVQAAVADDRITLAVPAGARDVVTVNVATIDPDIQPFHVLPKPLVHGGMRLPTVDQITVARQLTMRWLADPHDPYRCVEIGLAADRVGAEGLWTERMAASTTTLLPDLVATVRHEAAVRIHDPAIPRRLARQAQRGLSDLERHLVERQQMTIGR